MTTGKLLAKKAVSLSAALILLISLLAGCSDTDKKVNRTDTFTILSASENKEIAPIIQQFAKENHINIQMEYKGSVDIMQALKKPSAYDAVWPANSMWITMGDTKRVVKSQKSIMTSPVVFGIRKSVAERLGFVGKDVSVKDILTAIQDKKLTFAMTSATQSNSGASAYIGFLYALLGHPQTITSDQLQQPALKSQMRELLAGINRSSGSSEWLKEWFLKSKSDAMVNYESVIISTNRELIKKGREPLYVVYPKDGLSIADSPLGYVDNGKENKEKQFNKLQNYLLSDQVQKKLLDYGRRTGIGGTVTGASAQVFNPDWGIDTKRVLSPIHMPSVDVIHQALNLYQTELRKPSFTVYALDFSGSMAGDGEQQMKKAMDLLLNQKKAKTSFLQASPEDVTIVIPFSDRVKKIWSVRGNNPSQLLALDESIKALDIGGGTDIYSPVIAGIKKMESVDLTKYAPSIILMTDGMSNTGQTYSDMKQEWNQANKDIPIFSITFGDASDEQLGKISNLTHAAVFDGRSDLVAAFKKAKGYN